MNPAEALREFIDRRLSAAAGEIFRVFLPTLVQYQEQIQAQQRLLEISRRKPTRSHLADDPQPHFCKEEKVWSKQRHSNLDQEPEPPQIKEEQEEPEHPQIKEEHQEPEPPQIKDVLLGVNQEADTIMVTLSGDKSEHREDLDSFNLVRQFINERLTAAAGEEIFTMFQQTIIQYQEEICAHQRLLESSMNPQIKLHRIDGPQQEMNFTLKQEEPETLQIKEEQQEVEDPQIKEQQELYCSQKEEQLELKQEVITFMVIPAGVQNEPDPERLLSRDSVSGSQHQNNIQLLDSGAGREAELKSNIRRQSENVDNSAHPQQNSFSSMTAHTGEKLHCCEICWKKFRFPNNLLRHKSIHSGVKPHSCETCGKNFTRCDDLRVHLRIHTGEKPHSCVKCGKSFSKRGNLSVHMRIHTGEKPYSCVTCGKSFNVKRKLVTHMNVHTGKNPHSCATCGKSFSGSFNLLRHVRIHTGEKPHSCVTCGKSFSGRFNLLRHIRIHTGEKPHSCVTCGESFSRSDDLLVHMRLHSGEKPHSCATCGKNFSRKSLMLVHMKIHSSEKPYSCETCGRSYGRRSVLLRHIRIHTGEKPY